MPIIVKSLSVCDVCRLLDGDLSLKNCGFCSLCDSWICEADRTDWLRRARAAVARKLEPNYKGLPEYTINGIDNDRPASS
jgi:hypothetical protein